MNVIRSAFQRLFLSGGYFTIAVRRRQGDSGLPEGPFRAEYVFPANRRNWCADPMLAEENGKAYLFYEAVTDGRGRIEVRELREDCTVSEPTLLLGDEGHYSYPFVFQANGTWYMIPESSDREEVRLLRADPFPYAWKLDCVLLRGRFVDTTVFPWEDGWSLLTFRTDDMTERVFPQAFELRFSAEKPVMRALAWPDYDTLCVRGAGPAFAAEEGMIRPVQVNSEHRYGDSVAFHRISVSEEGCYETRVGVLTPENVQCAGTQFDGLHTYSVSQHFETIDLRCQKLDWTKPFRRLWHRIRR